MLKIYIYIAYLQAGWDEIKVGKYEFPFALKVTPRTHIDCKLTTIESVSECQLSTINGRT